MALARCTTCGGPQGLKRNYTHFHVPVSSETNNVLCGSPNCARRASIWLTDEEERQYSCGERSFRIPSRALQVQVF
jgi:hypothetical protein